MRDITPRLLLGWLIDDFLKICIIGIIFGVISIAVALSIPNKYSSNAIVISNLSDSKSMGGALSNLSGIASLAGVSLGGGSTVSPEVLKDMLNSNSFVAEFIRAKGLEKEVIATINYTPETNKFVYDDKLYDDATGTWVRKFKFPQTLEPSDAELAEKFKESFSAKYDRKTKAISINFTSYSPEFSKKTIVELVSYFNAFMRKRDLKDSENGLMYLQSELEKAKYSEVKNALQQVMEEQLKKLALAKTRDDYALRYVQEPMTPAKKSGPKRAIICLAITVGGTAVAVILIWTIRLFRSK